MARADPAASAAQCASARRGVWSTGAGEAARRRPRAPQPARLRARELCSNVRACAAGATGPPALHTGVRWTGGPGRGKRPTPEPRTWGSADGPVMVYHDGNRDSNSRTQGALRDAARRRAPGSRTPSPSSSSLSAMGWRRGAAFANRRTPCCVGTIFPVPRPSLVLPIPIPTWYAPYPHPSVVRSLSPSQRGTLPIPIPAWYAPHATAPHPLLLTHCYV
eukprot:gene9117-biopygen16704